MKMGLTLKDLQFVDKLKIKAFIDMKKRTINNRTFSETAIQKFSDQVLVPIIEPLEYDNGTYDKYTGYYDYKSVIGGFNKGSNK